MDVREKLVELLGNIYLPIMDGPNTIGEYTIPHKFNEKIADYLISHGVTVQGWVPVAERLPEAKKFVLVYDEINGVCLDYHDGDTFGYCEVTHWMPLPSTEGLE